MILQNVIFSEKTQEQGVLVLGVFDKGVLGKEAELIDNKYGNFIKKAIEVTKFDGAFMKCTKLINPNENFSYVLLVGLGAKEKLTVKSFKKIGELIYKEVGNLFEDVFVSFDEIDNVVDNHLYVGFGALLRSWCFDNYKTKEPQKCQMKSITLKCKNEKDAVEKFSEYLKIAEGIFLARKVISEPANVMTPEVLADVACKELLPLGVKVEVLDTEQMRQLGMNALLAVGQGSKNEPKFVIMRWDGANDVNSSPVAFVGKGVTFDSGGISIKPADGMDDMKYDMAGAGTVLGAMKAVALAKLKINVVGVMGLVENMPSGSAQRPGDIVKSMSGKTIEVLNTDAEGRMVLADAICYVQKKFNPAAIIDIATLTGAVVVALGHEFAGLLSNNDQLANEILATSNLTCERLWRLPMCEEFDRAIDSDIADVANISKRGSGAGTITAAHFLKRFIDNECPWAHIDIAGVEWSTAERCAFNSGVTGFGVHLFFSLLKESFMKKNAN